jgi:hypothetical protein
LVGEGREGFELEETILALDKETQEVTAGGARQVVDDLAMDARLTAYLEGTGRQTSREEILADVEGKSDAIRSSLQRLVNSGRVPRSGTGKKGDPFLFSIPCTPTV